VRAATFLIGSNLDLLDFSLKGQGNRAQGRNPLENKNRENGEKPKSGCWGVWIFCFGMGREALPGPSKGATTE